MKYNRIALYIWVIFALPAVVLAGNAEIWVERADMNPSRLLYIGDEVVFNIMIDTQGEQITGVATYITIDPDFLQPVFPGGLPYGKPFTPGRFLLTGSAVINSTHLDSLHLSDQPGWGNGLDGFQLDYYQSTGPVLNGTRPSVRGIGVVASFKLRVVGMPENANDSTAIAFDFKNDDNRLSTYYKLSEPSNEQRFRKYMNYSMFIAGFRIYPEIPDTLIPPGSSFQVNLNDHVTSNSDNYEIAWSMSEQQALNGAVSTLDDTLITVTTTPVTKGVLKLKVVGVQKNTNYVDNQVFNVGVDNVPVVNSSIPTVEFNEDESVTLPKSYFFTDLDDEFSNITVTPGSSNLLIQDVGDSIKFSATQDWFGAATAELFIQDPVQQQVNDTTRANININVLSVNDAPVLNLTDLDPISLFYGVTKYITMTNGVYINDVDDEEFVWSVESMDSVNLSASFEGGNILKLEALSSQFIGNVEIKITAMDDENGLDTARVNVYIQPTPVILLPIPTIILLSGHSKDILLNDYVDYPEDIKSELVWTFEVLSSSDHQPDTEIGVEYNNISQMLTLSAPVGYIAQDEIYVTVSAGNENRDSGKTLLKVLPADHLTLFPLPDVTIMQGTDLDVLDLSRYVVDPVYSIDDIGWDYSGGDSLEAIYINPETNILTLSADTVFLGTDSVKIIASNPEGETSARWLKVHCIEYNPNPVFTTPLPDVYMYWKTMTPQLYVDLDEYIWDFSTPDSSIQWRIDYDHLYMDITRNESNVVKIATFNKIGEQMVVFTATNLNGLATSDTIMVTIAKLGEPVWRTIPSIELSRGQVYSSIFLNRFCISGGNDVIYTADYNAQELDISIDSNTTQVFISSVNGFSGNSSVVFCATNDDTSSVSNLVSVTVSQKSSVSCFFNSIVSNRINFVVNSDKAVRSMNYHLLLDGAEQSLDFKKIDSTEAQKIWVAPFTFSKSGLYKLNLMFYYANGLTVSDSLWVTTLISADLGKSMSSSDQCVIIDTRDAGGAVLLTENEQFIGGWPDMQRVYTLMNSKGDAELRVKANSGDPGYSPYYGFYQIDGNEVLPIATTTDGQGWFYTRVENNAPFIFSESGSPAAEDYVLRAGIASYPNPFNSQVMIRYIVDSAENGTISIYNVLGQQIYVRKLERQEQGVHEFNWNSLNQAGNPVPTGLYFVRVQVGGTILTHKVLLIR